MSHQSQNIMMAPSKATKRTLKQSIIYCTQPWWYHELTTHQPRKYTNIQNIHNLVGIYTRLLKLNDFIKYHVWTPICFMWCTCTLMRKINVESNWYCTIYLEVAWLLYLKYSISSQGLRLRKSMVELALIHITKRTTFLLLNLSFSNLIVGQSI